MDSIPEGHKHCIKCGEVRPLEGFRNDKTRSDGKHPYCKPCKKVSDNRYYRANFERISAQKKDYNERTRDAIRARKRQYYQDNREQILAKQKEEYDKNPAPTLESNKAWKRKNRQRMRELQRRHVAANPDRYRAIKQGYRARKRNAEGTFSAKEWREKLEQYAGHCHWCHELIEGTPHADHLIALSKGGTNYISNIVPACAECNFGKKAKMPWDFNGRLL